MSPVLHFMRCAMEPGIWGKAPFNGTPTPVFCPGCGDRLFSTSPGHLVCELCGAEVNVANRAATKTLSKQRTRPAMPVQAHKLLGRQRRKTGALVF